MKEKLRQKTEKPDRPRFIPCGKITNGGPFYDNGTQCLGGYVVYNAMTYDSHGNELGLDRYARKCKCLKAYEAPVEPDGKMAAAEERRSWEGNECQWSN